jgi:hypothetical protein
MKLVVDGERLRFEVSASCKVFRRWSKGNWSKGKWMNGDFYLTTPLFYFDAGVDFWLADIDDAEQPKYSRAKRFTVTLEHGQIKGYKE